MRARPGRVRNSTRQQSAGGREVDLVVGDHLLDHAEIGELAAESVALADIVDGDRVRPLRRSEPAHHVGHPRRAKADLRVAVPLVDLAEHILVGDEDVGERHLAVPADHGLVDGVDVAVDADAGVSPGARNIVAPPRSPTLPDVRAMMM